MDKPEQTFHIFIVDDDPSARLTAIAALEGSQFAVSEFADASSLLAALEDFSAPSPDLILLDIEMPGMNGIDACRTLRAGGNEATQVVFVSAHNDLETRLSAYDAGGNDFIVKPFELSELARKVEVVHQLAEQRSALGEQTRYAQQVAFTAMSSMGEMGHVLEFLRASFSCTTAAELADKLLDSLRQFELGGLIEIRDATGTHPFSSRGPCSPLECSILAHIREMGRIFQFRDRMAINYPGITLVVLELPLGDPDRIGRLRDHLALLAEGAEVRLQAMTVMRQQHMQASGIADAVIELTATLDEIDRLQADHRLRAAAIDEAYLEDLISAFVNLGLSEDQEKTLADMAQHTHYQLAQLRDEGSNVSDHLRTVIGKLQKLVGK